MADFHHQGHDSNNQQQRQQMVTSPLQQQQRNYLIAQLQQQQQFVQQQQRPQSQPILQTQQQIGGSNNGISSMQHNFVTAQHQQQLQQQFRSVTSPHPTNIMQQRPQAFSHPGMLQQTVRQQQQGSPQHQQMFHTQQTIQQRPIIVRQQQAPIAQQQQQRTLQQQQQHYMNMHYVRQQGIHNNIIQVTTSSPMLAQHQFVQSSQQQSQMRQMLMQSEPSGLQYRQNILIQREQQQKSLNQFAIRAQIPVTTSTGRLTPQQESHVLQQHFSGAQNQQQSLICSTEGMQQRVIVQQRQQHRPITVVHTQHQQIPVTSAIISATSGGVLTQQQPIPVSAVYLQSPVQMSSPQQPFSVGTQNQIQQNIQAFSSPPTSLYLVAQTQQEIQMTNMCPGITGIEITTDEHNTGEISTDTRLKGTNNDSFIGKNHKTPDPSDGIIKQEASPVVLDQQHDTSPFNESGNTADIAAIQTQTLSNAAASTSKSIKKSQTKAATATKNASSSKNAPTKSQASKPSATTELELVKASVPGTTLQKLLDKEGFNSLVKTVDPEEILEDEVVDTLQCILDDFVDDIVRNSVELSRHRDSTKIEAKDVRFILANRMKMAVPAESVLGGTSLNNTSTSGTGQPPTKRPALIAHQQRMALIDKSLKKM